jgi:flagellin
MANSINTNISAYYAQLNIGIASNTAQSSVSRLSSGNRIVKASDDVAALSTGTSLRTQVTSLKTALTNAAQGTSLLQVADGALSQVTEILQRQKAIALQAGSGSLTDTDRGYLNQEFQALSAEIDRLAESANFNGVKLVNGGLSSNAAVTSNTTAATAGVSRISFNGNIAVGERLVINGVSLRASNSASSGTSFQVGGNITGTLDNLAAHLNSLADNASYNSSIGAAVYSRDGNSLVITARAGGSASNSLRVTDTATTAVTSITAGNAAFVAGNSVVTITSTAHGLSTGDVITLGNNANSNGDAGANGIANHNLFGKHTITVTGENTFTIDTGVEAGTALVATPITGFTVAAQGVQSTISINLGINKGYAAGQVVTLSGLAQITSGTGTIEAAEMNGDRTLIAYDDVTGIATFLSDAITDAQGTGVSTTGGGSAGVVTATTNATALSYKLASATSNGQAEITGASRQSYFNLFGTTTGLTSATSVIANATATGNAPFQVGNALTLQVDGVTKTLHTFATGDTLQSVVDGINNNKGTTGVGAALIRSGATYNIRLSYEGTSTNVIVDGGANYNSDTAAAGQTLVGSGVNLSAATGGTVGATAGASDRYALVFSSYFDVLTNAGGTSGDVINVATGNIATSVVTAASPSANTAPFRVGDSLTVKQNGQSSTLHTFGLTDTLADILESINSKTADTGIYAALSGSTGAYGIRLYSSSDAPATDVFTVDAGAGLVSLTGIGLNNKSSLTTTGATLTRSTVTSLTGGADNGLSQGSVSVTGSVGDNILAGYGSNISQSKAEVAVILTQNAVAGDTITVGDRSFTFTSNTSRASNEILIGSSVTETIDNAISTINAYSKNGNAVAEEAYQMGQIDLSRNGSSIVFKGKTLGNVYALDGTTAANIGQTITGASRTNGGDLNNASSTYGVDVTGITNADFNGKVTGFKATYKDTPDTIDLSVKIGDFTYTAKNVDVTVASDTRIRLYSDTVGGKNGGFFDIQLDAGNVASFSNQAGATAVANRLDSAFSSLSFNQKRAVSSYAAGGSIIVSNTVTGSLAGTKVSAQLSDFSAVKLTNLSVTAPSGSNTDAKISLTINGVDFSTASGLGSRLGANQTYKLLSAEDPNQFVEFTTGDVAIELDTSAKASAAKAALVTAFGINADSAALSFQIGSTATDTLAVSIGSATTSSLYDGKTLDVLTQSNASSASTQLDKALQTVTTLRASVGALQSRFNFASANIQISIQNQDAARGELLDTDVATESTNYATAQVKIQAGISVLAQANQQLQNLLKLIQ